MPTAPPPPPTRCCTAAADGTRCGSGSARRRSCIPAWRRCCARRAPRDLLVDRSRRPGCNEGEEDRLRAALEAVCGLPHAEACDRVVALEKEHKDRRGWVWAQLGQSPLAQALEPLARLAALARTPLGGTSVRCDRGRLRSKRLALRSRRSRCAEPEPCAGGRSRSSPASSAPSTSRGSMPPPGTFRR